MKKAFGMFVIFLITFLAAACAGPSAYYALDTDNYVLAAYAEIELAEPDILDFTFQQSISDTMPPFTFRLLGEISWFYDYDGRAPLKDIDITSIYIYDIDGNEIQRITNLETARGWPRRGWPNEENLHGLHFADYNFDGYLDMALWRHDTGSRRAGAFYYWLWDSQQMQFVLSQELIDFSAECQIEIDEDLQRLVHHNQWYDRGTTIYGQFINGAFVVAGSEHWSGVYAEDHVTRIGTRWTIRDYIADTTEIFYKIPVADGEPYKPGILDFTFTQSIGNTMPPFTFRMLGEISWSFGFVGQPLRSISIESIYIYDIDGNEIQRITNLKTASAPRWKDNLFGLRFADYNFDGHLDMALWRYSGGIRQSGAHYFWLWDNDQMQFVLSEKLMDFSSNCLIYVDRDLQRLITYGGWRSGGTTTYGGFIDGTLEVIGSRHWSGIYTDDGMTRIGSRITARDYIADTEEIFYEWFAGFEYALYEAFLESGNWVRIWCPQRGEMVSSVNNGRYEITAKRIFDFDGNGTLDLWFRAEDTNSSIEVITGFATIVDGQVMLLLSGYASGGSIGGTFVTSAYNQETSEHVITRRGLIGGFGGRVHYADFYSMENGELTLLYSIWHESHWPAGGGEVEEIFKVNSEEVSDEVYNQIAGKFIAPIDDYFVLNLH